MLAEGAALAMLIKTHQEIPAGEITPLEVFKARRTLIKAGLAAFAMGKALTPALGLAADYPGKGLEPTRPEAIRNYTNYYEFAYNKTDATPLAQALAVDPWSVEVGGAVAKPGVYHLEDILRRHPLQERVYRFRCVEGWAMVVPWLGFPLGDFLKSLQPTANARFVGFTSIAQPAIMPNVAANGLLAWPYVEGLRLDEAMHPLTLLATGLYGEALAKQNGAPLRLVVPWKYGFKSIKAIVNIQVSERPPLTSWNRFAPNEYGFYANVNPAVPHPRWSQRSERVLGSGFFIPRRPTELFNGYAEQVAALYADMDLRHFF